MEFPTYRPRRLRASGTLRSMVRETELHTKDFIYPLFVKPGEGLRDEVPSMPGVFQITIDQLPVEIDELKALGIPAVILFGLHEYKDESGSGAYAEEGIVQRAIAAIKAHDPEYFVITDVCLCEYTSHGHCGVLDGQGMVVNDITLELLASTALSHV